MALPTHVAFKGDNGKYLGAQVIEGYNYLQFSSSDIGDPRVRHTVCRTGNPNLIRLSSDYFNKYWRRSPNWIWADTNSWDNGDTLFEVVQLDGNRIALRNRGNNYFCKRLTTEGKTSCLNAAVNGITVEAVLVPEEPICFRRIYNVVFRLNEATTNGTQMFAMDEQSTDNYTSVTNTDKLTLAYEETETRTWNFTNTMKIAIVNEFRAGVPKIAEAGITISAEFTGSYSCGSSIQKTTQHKREHTVTVPPKTRVTVQMVATKGTCVVPFSYTQTDTLTNGETRTVTLDDGVYTGVNCYSIRCEDREKPLK